MADETAKTSLVFDATGAKQGAEQFAAAGEKVISTNEKVLKSTERQAAALDRFAKSWNPVLAAADRAGRQLDSVWDIFQKAEGKVKTKAFDLLTPAIDRANKSMRDLAAGFDVAARIDQLSAKFDPVTTSARRMAAEIAELNQAQRLGVNIAGGYATAYQKIVESYDEGAQAARRAREAELELAEAMRKANEEAQKKAVAAERAAQAQHQYNVGYAPGLQNQLGTVGGRPIYDRATNSASDSARVFQEQFEAEEKHAALLQRLVNQYDPVTSAAMRYKAAIEDINLAERENVIKGADAQKLRDAETKSYGAAASNVDAATKYLGNFRDAAFGARFASQQLGVQTIQFFSSLQAGQPFMQAFIGQAHQIVDVAIATGTGFRTIADAIKGWITGLMGWVRANPIVAGATAAIAALTALGAMAESTQRRLGTLRTELSGTREDYQKASERAEEASKFLARNTELSTSDSRKAAQTIFADPTFNGTDEQVEKIAVTFDRLSKVLHESETNWKRMGDAMRDPVKVLDELASSGLTEVTSGLRRQVKDLMDSGHAAEAFRITLEALQRQTANVANNLTPIQKALNELNKEFAAVGQGGRSMADLIGSIVDTAAVAAISTLTTLVKEFRAIYDLLKDLKPAGIDGDLLSDFFKMLDLGNLAKEVSGGIKNIFTGGISDWLRQQAASPGVERTAISSAGALGTMQLMPGTARDLGVNPFIQSENILGGVRYIAQLSKRFGGNEDLISRAYNAGPGGNLAKVGGYAAQVAAADPSKLSSDVATQIETAGRAQGLAPNLIELAKRIAMVENRGQQGPVNAAARYIDPSKGGQILTGAPGTAEATTTSAATGGTGKGDATYKQRLDEADELRKKQGLLTDQQKELQKSLEKLTETRKQAFDRGDADTVALLDKQIAALNGDIYRTVSAQEQLARQMRDQAAASQALTEGDQKQIAIRQQLNELNKQHPDTASAANDAKILSAALEQQNGEYRRMVFSIQTQITEQASLAAAYEKGYDAVVHATAANKALIDSMKLYALGSKEQIAAAKALTDQYEQLARAEQMVQAAQMHATNRDTVELLNAEVDALGKGSLERERYLAHVQKEIELKKTLPTVSQEVRDALLAENDAIVAQQQALKVHQQAMDELAGAITQSFDTIGNAITQSFVQGTGAAVNWGNVVKSVFQQAAQQFFKLAILNPALNALVPGGQHRPTLDEALFGPDKMKLPANDNIAKEAADKIKLPTELAKTVGGLPIEPGLNAVRVTNVGAGGLGGGSGSGGGGSAVSPANGVITTKTGTEAGGGGENLPLPPIPPGQEKWFVPENPAANQGNSVWRGNNGQVYLDTSPPKLGTDVGVRSDETQVINDALKSVSTFATTVDDKAAMIKDALDRHADANGRERITRQDSGGGSDGGILGWFSRLFGGGSGGSARSVDPATGALRVVDVGSTGSVAAAAGGGTGIGKEIAAAAKEADQQTEGATKNVGTDTSAAGGSSGGLLNWIGKQGSNLWDGFKGLFGGGSGGGRSGGGGGGASGGGGFLSKIGDLFKNYPGGLLDSVFGKGFYEGGGLIGSMFGGSSPQEIPVETGDPQVFSDAGLVVGQGGAVDSGVWDLPTAHTGGLVGVDDLVRRSVSPLAFMRAPRFHTGMNSDEFAAVLQRGERVLTANQNTKLENMMTSTLPQGGGAGAMALTNAMKGMGSAANNNFRGGGDVTNNNGHTIHVSVGNAMNGDAARQTGYQVGAAVASKLQRVSSRNQP